MQDEERDSELRIIGKKAHDTYALLSNLYTDHDKIVQKMQELEKMLASKIHVQDVQEYMQKLNEALTITKQKIDSLQYEKDVMCDQANNVKRQVEDLVKEVLKKQQDVVNILASLQEVKDYAKHLSDLMLDAMHANLAKQKNELLLVIDALPIPTETISEKQAAALIETMVEPIRLDASNSLLTARNHDLRLTIVEKKVENILLQLKNMGLK